MPRQTKEQLKEEITNAYDNYRSALQGSKRAYGLDALEYETQRQRSYRKLVRKLKKYVGYDEEVKQVLTYCSAAHIATPYDEIAKWMACGTSTALPFLKWLTEVAENTKTRS